MHGNVLEKAKIISVMKYSEITGKNFKSPCFGSEVVFNRLHNVSIIVISSSKRYGALAVITHQRRQF